MNAKILLVEDESDLTLIVADTLRGQGYEVVTAADGLEGLEKFKAEGADIVVADVMMPKMDGFSMARGFAIGANDYLRKPFELRELIVRIKALLSRYGTHRGEDVKFSIGQYVFNVTTQTLSIGERSTELSHFEARILEHLAANIGKTVDASELMIAVWQRDEPSNRNSLHGYIHKLRRALRQDSSITIINQRGFGYMLTVHN